MLKNDTGITWKEKTVALSLLKPYEKNPRKISPKHYEILRKSILENGYHQRIIATKDLRVIGGHQRIKILKELGFEEIIVLIPDKEIPDDQFKRILVQDNLPFGEFDKDMLALEFTNETLFDLGFPDEWMPKNKAVPDNADDAPPLLEESVSKLGDIWRLGNHRLMCGDSTSESAVSALLNGIKPHLMVTDPPYGVEYYATWRKEAMPHTNPGKTAIGKVTNDDNADWTEAWALFPGNIAYVWHADRFSPIVAKSLEDCNFKLRNMIIWAKSQLVIGRGDYHHQHEPCWYAVKGTGNWCGDRKQTTLWEIPKPQKSETGHSTQKPVECMKRPIENNSSAGQAVYEPFSGSGTTIIAAEITDRHCYAMEISPAYVDMGVKRWEAFTKGTTILEATGQSFSEVAKSRQV